MCSTAAMSAMSSSASSSTTRLRRSLPRNCAASAPSADVNCVALAQKGHRPTAQRSWRRWPSAAMMAPVAAPIPAPIAAPRPPPATPPMISAGRAPKDRTPERVLSCRLVNRYNRGECEQSYRPQRTKHMRSPSAHYFLPATRFTESTLMHCPLISNVRQQAPQSRRRPQAPTGPPLRLYQGPN